MKANITYKSVLARYANNIEKRNEVFNSLDKQSQRLEIAWDALQLVLTEKVEPSLGCYWSNSLLRIGGKAKKFQEILINKLPSCQVCQRGLMMLSQIRIGNCIDSEDSSRSEGDYDNIKGFEVHDFRAMEKEYENSYFMHQYGTNTKEKLANICCNILVNGNFNENDRNNYLIELAK